MKNIVVYDKHEHAESVNEQSWHGTLNSLGWKKVASNKWHSVYRHDSYPNHTLSINKGDNRWSHMSCKGVATKAHGGGDTHDSLLRHMSSTFGTKEWVEDDRKSLANEISTFLNKYGKKSANDPSEWNSPDAYELENFASALINGRALWVPFSEWGSGGYHPYISPEGRKAHDVIMKKITNFVRNKPKGEGLDEAPPNAVS